jgi:stringent starvation protein B
MSESVTTSTRPYLIRALYEWCTDNGLTPYVAVRVDDTVRVPREYVKDGEIVLNISLDATSALKLGNDYIEFKARFAGVARDIMVPLGRVMAIYARENGQGMAFPLGEAEQTPAEADASVAVAVDAALSQESGAEGVSDEPEPPRPGGGAPGGRPALKRVK